MDHNEYELLKADIVSEYNKIQLQQQKEIFKLSKDLRIVQKIKDELLLKITILQDELNPDQGNTGVDELLSRLSNL